MLPEIPDPFAVAVPCTVTLPPKLYFAQSLKYVPAIAVFVALVVPDKTTLPVPTLFNDVAAPPINNKPWLFVDVPFSDRLPAPVTFTVPLPTLTPTDAPAPLVEVPVMFKLPLLTL